MDAKQFNIEFYQQLANVRETLQLEVTALVKSEQISVVVVAVALRQIAEELIGQQVLFDRYRLDEIESDLEGSDYNEEG